MIREEFFSYAHLSDGPLREMLRLFHDGVMGEDGRGGHVVDLSIADLAGLLAIMDGRLEEGVSISSAREAIASSDKLIEAINIMADARREHKRPDVNRILRLVLEAKDCAARSVVIDRIDKELEREADEAPVPIRQD